MSDAHYTISLYYIFTCLHILEPSVLVILECVNLEVLSGTRASCIPCEEFWAKLVPSDSRYPDVEISSDELAVCSKIVFSSIRKCKWCNITRNSDHSSAKIQNKSSNAIVVDGTVIQAEDTIIIRCGSEITSGPDMEGYLSYRFNVLPGPETYSSLKRSNNEVATLDPYATIQSNLVVNSGKHLRGKRARSQLDEEADNASNPCPQCGTEYDGFRCNQITIHLQCQACRGMMPSRTNNSVPQHCLGCDKAFCDSPQEASNREEYKEAVLEAKEHILAGDIFQIVLSQRFERRTFADPFEVYRALRIVNPSPYMTYLQARGCILVASSPEILTRVKKQTITNRPLAGTVRRGKTPKEDLLLEKQLLNDEKQFAEHIMLVDLGRNDVGKVTGELLDDLTSWDVLHTALPVGTVSGAPKVKAMELIDKLEVIRRGPYSGGFGGISFSGNMDIALALRTIVFPTSFRYDTMYSYKDANKRREWVAHLQAGAGIVADSDPADEQRKCENKAAALARAIDLAESSFVDPVMPGYFVYKSGNFGLAEVAEGLGTKPCEEFWAKLVPSDSRYPDVEISSCEIVVCSEILFSSIRKCKWCKITRNSDHSSATIQNKSSNAIVVDRTLIQAEDTIVIRCGSEITSGPDKEGYLSYKFNVLPGPESCQKKLKMSMDAEHAICCIYLNIWHDVVTVAPCFHNFCNGCFAEWLKRSLEKRSSVLCPHCRAIVQFVGRNHFLLNVADEIVKVDYSLKRTNDEVAILDSYATIQSNLVVNSGKHLRGKRACSQVDEEADNPSNPCPQCGTEYGGFRCNQTTIHLQCQACGGMMPSRTNNSVPQHCLGCDKAFCSTYWHAQRVSQSDSHRVCCRETFKPISAHENNRHEQVITEKCIAQLGRTLQDVIAEWLAKLNNREID
ncbi:hypothetical protein FF1_005987 [Malus domestica]